MFTGLIEEIGEVRSSEGGRAVFSGNKILFDTRVDDSISVNGVCLSVVAIGEDWWAADLTDETLGRTTMNEIEVGDMINLERAVRVLDRIGGHIVQGHVDGVGEIVVAAPNLRVKMPHSLCRYVVEKGSVAVDGISLTVVEALDDGFTAAIIPHTIESTIIGQRVPGDHVNIEVELLARYAERILHFTSLKG